jgi:hypothetical protein
LAAQREPLNHSFDGRVVVYHTINDSVNDPVLRQCEVPFIALDEEEDAL